ncbi:hypothetical protein CHS0354_026255, partial [Potamilus streckersoni]
MEQFKNVDRTAPTAACLKSMEIDDGLRCGHSSLMASNIRRRAYGTGSTNSPLSAMTTYICEKRAGTRLNVPST